MAHFADGERWRMLGAEYLYESPWCSFRVDEVRLPDGVEIEYGVLESAGFAAVTQGGGIVLVRQWRQPVGAFTLELPGGGLERREDATFSAARPRGSFRGRARSLRSSSRRWRKSMKAVSRLPRPCSGC